MKHFASPDFWTYHKKLPEYIRTLADKNFVLLKADFNRPSLHFKKIGRFWSVRVGLHYRALGMEAPEGILWFWIGSHADYDKLVKGT